MFGFKSILCLIFFTIVACVSYQPQPISPLFKQVIKKEQILNFYLEGKLKIKRTGYGWIGKIQLVKANNNFRLDVFTSLDWPLCTVIKKGNKFVSLYYPEGRIYTSEEPPEFLKSLLPHSLPMDAWITLLGNQIWLITPDRYQIKAEKDKYFIWLEDRKRYLIEEIWIRKLGFKIEKITFKTGKGEILCRICFRYDSSRQVSGMKMRDRQGTIVEITYKTFSPSPEIDPNMFNLFPNF